LGWPLINEGVDICWKGPWTSREGDIKARIFRDGAPFKKGRAPMEDHVGSGEEAAFIDAEADANGICRCGIHNPELGIALTIEFNKEQLPWLTNWQHWGPGEYVVGLEPGTHPPVGQSQTRNDGSLILLKPKERREYDVTIRILDQPNEIAGFLSAIN
jgi:hypothetical protein